jgi:hypothetical protein
MYYLQVIAVDASGTQVASTVITKTTKAAP